MVQRNSASLRAVADSTATVLIARFAQIVGIPLGLFVIYQLAGAISQMTHDVQDARDRLRTLETTVQIKESNLYYASDAAQALKLVSQREDSMAQRVDSNSGNIGELRSRIEKLEQRVGPH